MKQKGSSDIECSLWNHLDKKVILCEAPLFLRVYYSQKLLSYLYFKAENQNTNIIYQFTCCITFILKSPDVRRLHMTPNIKYGRKQSDTIN